MRILHGLKGLRELASGSVLTIGNFDGIHLGHAKLLARCRELRDVTPGSELAVATFEPHPLTVLRPALAPPRLTNVSLKQSLLESQGVDELVILPPSQEVLNVSAEEFWQLLRDDVRPAHIVEGESFTFGKGRAGTLARLRAWAAESKVQVHTIEPAYATLLDMQWAPVSSSLIRFLLANGRARDAAICLGRSYRIEGRVIRGHQRGRTIGVPTANLQCDDQLIPADGVYAARAIVNETTYPAALSIGTLPTFGPNVLRQIEAHLIGFDGDLYGSTLPLELIDWSRDQRKFASVDALKAQLASDIAWTQHRASEPLFAPTNA